MKYVSTRGCAPVLGFEDVLLTGLAEDGGLYVPEAYPTLTEAEIAGLQGMAYTDVACRVMQPFVGDEIEPDRLNALIVDAYATFSHRAVAPLVQIGPDSWLLELFHGSTLAFKDVAMQVLARLMDEALARRGQRATIVAATSGDTGGAAVDAFRGRDAIDFFVLHPHGRVSDVQRRQMTTAPEANVHNLAIEGNFDDCQALVKALFNDAEARRRLSLSGVNSINWARIMAQTVYYFTSAVALGAPHRKVSYTVPTGNFGDILAGYIARRMGLAVDRLIIATNVNDILARTLESGRYEVGEVVPTTSPSMDIQVSSNFERLLFEAYDRDAAAVSRLMSGLRQSGTFEIASGPVARIRRDFWAAAASEAAVSAMIAEMFAETGHLVDPHTAVGLVASRTAEEKRNAPMITLATAHPAKFPDAVAESCGHRPELPERVRHIFDREERMDVIANDYTGVRDHILANARSAQAAA